MCLCVFKEAVGKGETERWIEIRREGERKIMMVGRR